MSAAAKSSPNGRLRVVSGPDPADKTPPQNLEAERSVLGSILLEPAILPEIIPLIDASDFYRDAHQDFFRAMAEMHARGDPVDSVTLPDELILRGQFEKHGGNETLREIVESVPHGANAKFYAGMIREKSIARQVVEAATLAIRDVYSHQFTGPELADRAASWFEAIASGQAPGPPIVVRASDVAEEPVEYLWENRLARAFVSLFAGQTSLGKTWVMLDIIARLTTGRSLPGSNEAHDPIRVLIISEDSQTRLLKPRLSKLGADLTRISFMTWEGMQGYTLDDAARLERAWIESGHPDLIVIDPPTNFTGAYNEHVNADVRKMLGPITAWLLRHESVCCALISHINKNITQGLEALDRVMGSVAWTSTPRIVVGFVRDPKDPEKCICGGLKNNLGDKAGSLSYSLSKSRAPDKVQWHGVSGTSADDALAKKPVVRDVIAWLEDRFRERREWESDELKALGVQAGFTFNALFKSEFVKALPIRRQQRFDPNRDPPKHWVWEAKPDWPPPRFSDSAESD